MENGNYKKPHAIMIPYPFQGHVSPFVYLATKLASDAFTITFVNTESIHHRISQAQPQIYADAGADIFATARESGLDIRYSTVPDGLLLGFDRSLNEDQHMECILHVFSAHVDELVGELTAAADPPVTCLIADTFYVWSSMIAEKYKIVNVSFWTEPALVLTLYYHLYLLRANRHFDTDDNRQDTIDYIPGVQALKPTDMMSYLQADDITTVVHRIIYRAFEDVKKADIIICNTVQELETETISALNKKQPIYAIGPIFPQASSKRIVATSLWSEFDCTQWLDTKPCNSVLYVSFGSQAHTSKHVIHEIANALLSSKVSFVWVVRPDIVGSDDNDFLPAGFEDRVRDRGLVVPWCHQVSVLSHSAIGGFLTHCGWNSILESIWCGVPLLCFPLLTDQFTNRKLVVDDWKIGINLCNIEPITMEEISMNIRRLMSGELSDKLRKVIQKVKTTSKKAVAKDGSSDQHYRQFIKDVEQQKFRK